MIGAKDRSILRRLAVEYRDAAFDPVMDERRTLWRQHNSLKPTRPPVIFTYGMWNHWCREVFGDRALQCQEPFYRAHERYLRMQLFHYALGDDFILEPWITLRATIMTPPGGLWGVPMHPVGGTEGSEFGGEPWKFQPALESWEDFAKMVVPHHQVDEQATAWNLERLQEAVGDIIPVNLDRAPAYFSFDADLSTHLGYLRGLEQLLYDMTDHPQQLHRLLAFMRDGILKVHSEAEQQGDWSLTSQKNQVMCYAEDLETPRPNAGPRARSALWHHIAAQEFTLVSPRMHAEFLLQYQIPIIEKFGLSAYGCCEDLTIKINLLRKIKNLRIIAISPRANVRRCAEQIGQDYVFSWRPNPALISSGFDRELIASTIRRGLAESRGCRVHILLKDVETVEGDLGRLSEWVKVCRGIIEHQPA